MKMVSRVSKWERWAFFAFLCASLVITLFPFIWMVSTSFKGPAEIFTQTPTFIPENPTLENYEKLLTQANLGRSFFNSLVFAIGMMVLSVFFNAMAAYAFAKLSFPGREKIFSLLLLTMMVPGQVTMMPVFLILKNLGLLNTFTGLILPGIGSVFGIFMLRQFMHAVPEEILEAARIDGCSEFRIFYGIMLPLCRPILATLAIFSFIGAWNEFFWPLIIMLREDMQTLPVALANLNGQFNTDWGLLMSGSVLVVIPVILVFLLAQKHYIKGIAAGGVKG
jgi:multiple sugar transport system permease protein